MTIDFDFAVLSSLGLTPALASRALQLTDATKPDASIARGLQLVRVTEVHRETTVVHDGRGERQARPLPRLSRELSEAATAVAVGDWVLAAADAHGALWIEQRVPPSTHIARRDSDGHPHPLVSNVDTALLLMGLDDDFNPRRLERYLALVHGEGVAPVVILTKRDVATPTDAMLATKLEALRGRVASGVEIVPLDATHASSADLLAAYLSPGQTLVLLGSSGAGKSTLTNTLLGRTIQDTGPVRANDDRGKHTTTSRSLHRLPGGACVIDTPGLRTLRPDGDPASLDASFEDVAALAERCRFRDCRHEQEPGCAVREGVASDRLHNYHKLLRELRRDSMSALDRQRQLAMWKARGRVAAVRMRAKRGE